MLRSQESHVASLAQAALLKKFGESDVCDFFAELDFRHWSLS
jgi:hypothetical protein